MDTRNIKLLAFDLDGTITQHKSPLSASNRELLDLLSKKYRLLIVGAGMCDRIFEQMRDYPIDIIGNYGMQYAKCTPDGSLHIIENIQVPCDRASVEHRITALRKKYGFENYSGESVEYHTSGCVTFPILGTKAKLEDKLAFDPDRKKRRTIYQYVRETFSDYIVFIGGSSSFDLSPAPYNKYYALNKYCAANGISHEQTVYVGDDYGEGGNDESVYRSDFCFVTIDDYRNFSQRMGAFL